MEDKLKNFIERGSKKFNGKYDYSKFEYVNAKTKSVIICPVHGEFIQSPDKHLGKNSNGCVLCWEEKRKLINRSYVKKDIIDSEVFLKRANIKYKNKFEYVLDNYNGISGDKIVVICPKHGEFKTTPHNHLLKNNKYGCVGCSNENRALNKTNRYDDVINKFKRLYNDKYDYPISNIDTYVNQSSNITIICPKHGEFVKKVQKHLSGQGCFSCNIETLVDDGRLVGGYSFELFEEKPELKTINSYLYYLEINDGEYYKIGITINDITNRIKSLKSRSKGCINKIKVIFLNEMSLYDSYCDEQKILNEFKDFRVYTKWSTELFNINVLNK